MAIHPVPRSCGVLLICGDPIRSFLLMKHADRWDLPKGHVDPGETDTECALREMYEETGIPPEKVTLLPDFQYVQQYEVSAARYGGKEDDVVLKTLILFLARVDREYDIQLTEHIGAKWFPWNSPPPSIQPRAIDPLLRAVDEYFSRSKQQISS